MGVALALLLAAGAAQAGGADARLVATPAHAEAGVTSAVTVRFRVPAAKGKAARVHLAASVGETTAFEPVGTASAHGGTEFVATWRPPPQRFPQVAFLHAAAEVEGKIYTAPLVLPIHGRDTLKLRTKPRAKVTVTVAGRTFDAGFADAKGEVAVTVLVPPGVEHATVTSLDRVGNRTHKPLPLHPPPFQRAFAAVAHPSRAASWADESPTRIEIIGITSKLAPLPSTAFAGLRAERGRVGSFTVLVPGRAVAQYLAAREVGSGFDVLTVELDGSPLAQGRGTVRLLPGPPSEIEVAFRPPVFVAGVTDHVDVALVVRDAHGNIVSALPDVQIHSDVGEVVVGEDGNRRLRIPPELAGRALTRLKVRVGNAEAFAEVPLMPGVPARGSLVLPKRMVRAGGDATVAEVAVVDAYGNPVTGANLDAKLVAQGAAKAARVVELGYGRYGVELRASPEVPPGDAQLEVRPTKGELSLTEPLVVLPFQREVGVSAGAWASALSNGGLLRAVSPAVEVAVRPTPRQLEVLLQGSVFRYSPAKLPHEGAGEGVFRRVELSRQQVALGGRYSLPLGARLSLQGSVLAGVSRTESTVKVEGLRAATPTVEEAPRWDPVLRGGAGISLRLGPGRLMMEGRLGFAPSGGQVSGNFDGVGAAVGYLVEVR